MTSCQIAAVVACRVLGLYTAILWLGLLPTCVFAIFRGPSLFWSSLGAAVFVVVPFALAVILWKLAPWIAKHMLADVESKQMLPSAITMEEVQVAAISILGLLFIIKALPGIVVLILNYFQIPGLVLDESVQSLARVNTLKTIVMRVTEIGLGTWLFLGARSFVRVMQRFCSPKCRPEP